MSTDEALGVSVIVPTYREVDTLPFLLSRLASVGWGGRLLEVLIIDDDSQDGTLEQVTALGKTYPWLRLVVRKENKGLSRAVLAGIQQAAYPLCVVMDADLSHPPEAIPLMLEALQQPGVECVIGSRYVPGGSTDAAWSRRRRWLSQGAAMLTRKLVGVPMADPLSGFFACYREAVLQHLASINPIGWKIGLEIVVKCRFKHIVEVPIAFSERRHGQSKLTLKVSLGFLKHLFLLSLFHFFHFFR